jgi:hypothetical protein
VTRVFRCTQGHEFTIVDDGSAAAAIAIRQTRERYAGKTCDEWGPFGEHGERKRCGKPIEETER